MITDKRKVIKLIQEAIENGNELKNSKSFSDEFLDNSLNLFNLYLQHIDETYTITDFTDRVLKEINITCYKIIILNTIDVLVRMYDANRFINKCKTLLDKLQNYLVRYKKLVDMEDEDTKKQVEVFERMYVTLRVTYVQEYVRKRQKKRAKQRLSA